MLSPTAATATYTAGPEHEQVRHSTHSALASSTMPLHMIETPQLLIYSPYGMSITYPRAQRHAATPQDLLLICC